jgi:hypothetical protein
MSDLQVRVRDYYALRPADYHVLSLMTLSQQLGPEGVCEQVLRLVLQKDFASAEASLHLEFLGVRKLAFEQPEWSLISVGHIEISLGREVVGSIGNFFVRDTDQERVLRFECRDFSAHVA